MTVPFSVTMISFSTGLTTGGRLDRDSVTIHRLLHRGFGRLELLDGLQSHRSATAHAGEHAVKDFQGTAPREVGELGCDALSAGGERHEPPTVRRAYSVSGRNSTSTILGYLAASGRSTADLGNGTTTEWQWREAMEAWRSRSRSDRSTGRFLSFPS